MTRESTSRTNAGITVAAGVVPGASLVNEVFQMLQRGSVVQVEASDVAGCVGGKAVTHAWARLRVVPEVMTPTKGPTVVSTWSLRGAD